VEDRLVAALEERDFVAFASHRDVPVLAASSAEEVLDAANRRAVVGLVLVNRALADGEPGPVPAPERITPLHPGLQAWYAQSRDEMDDPPAEGKAVFAEVNLFLVDGPRTRLFWSGTTWSFEQDGRGGAIEGITATIAEQMDRARSSLRRGG